jgi:hypothetical protein
MTTRCRPLDTRLAFREKALKPESTTRPMSACHMCHPHRCGRSMRGFSAARKCPEACLAPPRIQRDGENEVCEEAQEDRHVPVETHKVHGRSLLAYDAMVGNCTRISWPSCLHYSDVVGSESPSQESRDEIAETARTREVAGSVGPLRSLLV